MLRGRLTAVLFQGVLFTLMHATSESKMFCFVVKIRVLRVPSI